MHFSLQTGYACSDRHIAKGYSTLPSSDRSATEQVANARWIAHIREHELNQQHAIVVDSAAKEMLHAAVLAHQREHELGQTAIEKAEEAVNRRLEGMNDFRAQLARQQATFVTREIYDGYVTETERKTEQLATSTSDKYEAVLRGLASRHDTDFENLRAQIQVEREIRKAMESSINTWKWIVGFLGASGVGGVILLFITRAAAT